MSEPCNAFKRGAPVGKVPTWGPKRLELKLARTLEEVFGFHLISQWFPILLQVVRKWLQNKAG